MTTSHANIAALFSDIADQIRLKQGTTSSYVADAFPEAIKSIGENWVNKSITKFPLSTTCSVNIGSYAFYYCNQMSGAVQTNSPYIHTYAFYYCSKLTSLNFPNAVSVYVSAFCYCSAVTTAIFPKLTSIGSYAFASNYKLNTVSMPLVKSVSNYGFQYCSSLTTISLPSCTYLGTYAFRNCIRLVSLYLMGSTVCQLGTSYVFTSTPIGGYSTTAGQFGKVYVPSSLYATYIASTNWSLISSRIVSA